MLTDEEERLIYNLREKCKFASRLIRGLREDMQEKIDKGEQEAEVKFNGGNPAVLCAVCRRIVRTGVNPKTAKAEICPPGPLGCGEFEKPYDRA